VRTNPDILTQMRRILLVDDHEPFRKGIRSIIEGHYIVCAEACNGQEGVARAIELKPDLVVLDISMPTMGGFEAARRIRSAAPSTKILMLSLDSSPQVEKDAKAAGADAFVPKSAPVSTLLATVEQLLATASPK
jgi:DNA-binding NarL/FixJ family response regulator